MTEQKKKKQEEHLNWHLERRAIAEEVVKQGDALRIPYWRTLKADGFLNEKYPGGAEAHKQKLEDEGFTVLQRGKRYSVQNYQHFLTSE